MKLHEELMQHMETATKQNEECTLKKSVGTTEL